MKIFFCLFGLIAIVSFSQKDDLFLDGESFLLGTVSDYMGRKVFTNENDKIEQYGFYEKSLVDKICSLLVGKYDDLLIKKIETTGDRKICSKKLAEKINASYTYYKSGIIQNNEPVFYGQLQTNILTTELQKISFIVGAYSRFGSHENERYCIRLYNSMGHFSVCKKILKELKCEKIEVKIIENIPVNQLVYFEPSKKLMEYLVNYAYLRNQIEEDEKKTFKELSEKYR
ncbi:hypothetical protein FEM08_06800 [Flavobacterium gilvum]|nr:hypothetical protein FEM08_06800 [Flavobacterium gilvum]